MRITLPEEVNFIIHALQEHGFEAYAVGGCVRDSAIGRIPKDWDITTSAKPEQVKEIFKKTIDTGIQHGTVTVMVNHEGYEVTTYRIDGEYEDARHPKDVTFTDNLLEDLKRRDFTINAMAYNDEIGIVDAFDGKGDLERGIIRCVGDPMERFTEDALRMMRAVRFAAQLGFDIDEGTKAAIVKLAPTLQKISAERVRDELFKLITSPYPEMIRIMYETGITAVVLPEFDIAMQTTQNTPHHCYTVGEHIIHTMMNIPAEKNLRVAMLLHDIAKPACKITDENGKDHFWGHPQKGSYMAKDILVRLKCDNDLIKKVCALVKAHDDRPGLNEKSIRRAILRNGADQYPELFAVQRADTLAQSDYQRQDKFDRIDKYEKIYNDIIAKQQCLSLKDLAVKGSDLIKAGVAPGPQLGEILNAMFEDVINEPHLNDKVMLLSRFENGAYTKQSTDVDSEE